MRYKPVSSDHYDPSSVEIENVFRPAPFWSWNDELKPEELIRQIHEMHNAGIGGFFMHARGGLKTRYMSKEWMDAIILCVREARKLGMHPYLYDENGWPSGFGNGEVNGMGEEYQAKSIDLFEVEKLANTENILAWYDSVGRRLPDGKGAALAAQVRVNPFYVDNLNPAVTKEFIRCVYNRYWEELPEDVRTALAGIFTDEPQLTTAGIPCSPVLAEEFRRLYGIQLLDIFPELVREIGNWRENRLRFWRLVALQFRKSYIGQIGTWCREHGWELAGHHLMEESYDSQLNTNGAVMPQYEGYTIPGIDHLSRLSAYITSDMQVVSAAAQNGQPQILTETFGCSGWNYNMRGLKWLYQQHLVHGINLLCQHLAGYSLHGLRKRDYPASIFYQHPMWPHIKELHDAFSRVGRMLAIGQQECETLLIHGESTAWMRSHGHFQDRFSKELFMPFCQLSQALNAHGIPFHYGDEICLSQKGVVKGKRLHVGLMSYSQIILPPVENLAGTTIALLRELKNQGGRLLRLDSPARRGFFVDGRQPSVEDQALWDSIPVYFDQTALLEVLKPLPALTIRNLSGADGRVRGTWRHFPKRNERWYYLADFAFTQENRVADKDFWTELHTNIPEENTDNILEVTLPFPAVSAEVIDQKNGHVLDLLTLQRHPDGKCTFLTRLSAGDSLLIRSKNQPIIPVKDLTGDWHCQTVQNVLTLERAAFRLEETAPWSEETDTLSIFNRLLGMPEDTGLELRYSFHLLPELDVQSAGLKMAIESDENARYFLNGEELQKEFGDFFIDRSIRVLTLPKELLRHGENCFNVLTRFVQRAEIRRNIQRARQFESEANKLFYDSEVEAVYLLGQFGCYTRGIIKEEKKNSFYMDAPFVLGKMPESIRSGHALTEGFPFFSGQLTLKKSILLTAAEAEQLTTLTLAPFKANDAMITVNGHPLSLMYAPPYSRNVAGMLHEGNNEITIIMGTSCRNTMGPFHTPETEPIYVGPGAFLTEKDLLGWYCIPAVKEYGLLEFTPDQITLS